MQSPFERAPGRGTGGVRAIDLLVGPVQPLELPGLCIGDVDGSGAFFDYPTDPTAVPDQDCGGEGDSRLIRVAAAAPQLLGRFGAGTDSYRVDFALPEGFVVVDFALDCGPGVSRFVVNGTEIPVDVIHGAFPFRPATDDRLPNAAAWSFANHDRHLLVPYLVAGDNVIEVDVTASENWQARPFSLSARFLGHAAAPPDDAAADPNDAAAAPEPEAAPAADDAKAEADGGGFPAWAVVAVVLAAAGDAIAMIVTQRRRSI